MASTRQRSRRKRRGGLETARPGRARGLKAPPAPVPSHRRLKVFSLDPAVDVQLEHALISRSVLPVAWEPLSRGPVGEYLEVIDVDPSSGCVYDPVDLNDPDLLAQDGLSPSSGNPQFHQQMVYAVGMKTIANFEQVLGRKVLWPEKARRRILRSDQQLTPLDAQREDPDLVPKDTRWQPIPGLKGVRWRRSRQEFSTGTKGRSVTTSR